MKVLRFAQGVSGIGLIVISVVFALEHKYDHAIFDLLLGAVMVYWSERP